VSHLLSLPWDCWPLPLMALGQVMADSGNGGVSMELVMLLVGVFTTAFGAALRVIQQSYEKRLQEKDATIEEQKAGLEERDKRLAAYGSLAPDIVAEVRALLGPPQQPPPQVPPSRNDSTGLPYPYGTLRSKPIRRRPRPSADQP
jgi:hypothetical protein